MANDLSTWGRIVVFAAAIVYWSGVWIQTRRVRHRIGRSPNVRPRGPKEKLLWAGWAFVVVGWLTAPFLGASAGPLPGAASVPSFVHPVAFTLGIMLTVAGYAGTLWCYVAMGNAWRMGINRQEETRLVTNGPYRWVRHPIYACQLAMVAAIPLLIPSVLSLLILGVHLVCVWIKATDEEAYLRSVLGPVYEAYCARTGRWFAPLRRRSGALPAASAADRQPSTPPLPPFP
ncbi:MAG: methyltransferase family protein [Limisphaerales bacterium]